MKSQKHHQAQTRLMRGGIAPVHLAIDANAGLLIDAAAQSASRAWRQSLEVAGEKIAQAFALGNIVDSQGKRLSPNDPACDYACGIYVHRPVADECVIAPLEVLWQGPSAVVVNKPGTLATMPRGSFVARSVVVAARRQWQNDHIVAAHRLDRLTSGCLLLVTDPTARGAYQQLFDRREVGKTYRARTLKPSHSPAVGYEALWQLALVKEAGNLQVRVVDEDVPGAVGTSTLARLIADCGTCLEWSLSPETGFMHQLRAVLAAYDYPIIGDPLYPTVRDEGDPAWNGPMLLHAHRLGFKDPISKEDVEVVADVPWDDNAH